MKKAKFLIYAAVAAAAASISSCSDSGDLSAPAKDAEGKALVVNPTVDGSRAAALISDDFTGFKLFGFQNPQDGDTEAVGGFLNGASGIDYSGAIGGSWSTTATAEWPTVNPNNSDNFYALSVQGGSDLSESGVNATSLQTGIFSYTAPTTGGYVDPTKMKDIMIASSVNAEKATNNGAITLPFKHAFANVSLQLRWNHQEYLKQGEEYTLQKPSTGFTPQDLVNGAILAVDYIAFHNVYVNGDYSFVEDESTNKKIGWTVSGDKSVIKYQFAEPKFFYSKGNNDGIDATNKRFIVQDIFDSENVTMMVPQELEKWIYDSTADGYEASKASISTTSGAYIEIHCVAYHSSGNKTTDTTIPYWEAVEYDDDLEEDIPDGTYVLFFGNGDDLAGKCMKSFYFPLNKIASFDQNKKYNIRLNMMSILNENGQAAAPGVTVQF